MKFFHAIFVILPMLALPATAATFDYDIEITSITGDGEAESIGFFSTGSVGDAGTGSAIIEDGFPLDYPTTLDISQFQATFPGIATAGTFGPKLVVHDTTAGTLTVSGFLGGVTGPYSDFLSAGSFEFVFSGIAGGPVASSNADLNSFLADATMSGYFEGIFFVDGEFDNGFSQTISFASVTSDVPLPAGGVLLLTAIGFGWVARRR